MSDVLLTYGHAVEGLERKIQQDRGLHKHALANVYLEAVRTGVPQPLQRMLRTVVAENATFAERRTRLDAAELVHHLKRMDSTIAPHRDVLAGGGAHSSGLEGVRRLDKLVAGLNQKLAHERSVNATQLANVQSEAVRVLGAQAPFARMVTEMLSERTMYDARKTLQDAQHWGELKAAAAGALGGGGAKVLGHGFSPAAASGLAGGGTPTLSHLMQQARIGAAA